MHACMTGRRRNAQGRGAETIYRDKDSGEALTRDEYLARKKDKVRARARARACA